MNAAAASSRLGPAALLAVLAWWTARLAVHPGSGLFLDRVNLAFHEAGHLFLIPFGSTLHYLGGTIGQLAVPAALVVTFRRSTPPRPLGAAVCVWWCGENLVNIAAYMADARSLALPLVGGGDHDWNELFYRFGLLGEDSVRAVSGATLGLGLLVMLFGLGYGVAVAFFREPAEAATAGA